MLSVWRRRQGLCKVMQTTVIDYASAKKLMDTVLFICHNMHLTVVMMGVPVCVCFVVV